MRTKATIELSIEEMIIMEYAMNTAIDRIEALKALHVNLPEFRPENDLVGRIIALRDRCREHFV